MEDDLRRMELTVRCIRFYKKTKRALIQRLLAGIKQSDLTIPDTGELTRELNTGRYSGYSIACALAYVGCSTKREIVSYGKVELERFLNG